MPVSETSKRTTAESSPSSSSLTTRATSPSSVNFTALPRRLTRTCLMRPGSPLRAVGTSGFTRLAISKPFAWALSARSPTDSSTAALRSKSITSKSILPASIFEKSRMSLMMVSRLSAEDRTVSAYSLCSSSRSVSSSSPVMPMTPFMGVRISWDMFARNSDFARLASSAASFACFSPCSASLRSVTSRAIAETPTMALAESLTGDTVRERGTRLPSLETRSVSYSLTVSPRPTLRRTSIISSMFSGGVRTEMCSPLSSSSE